MWLDTSATFVAGGINRRVRGRGRKRAVVAALVALVLAGAAAAAWLVVPMLTYDAISAGDFDGIGDGGRSVQAGPFGSYIAKRYVAQGRTTIETSIANRGDRDVEIVELGDVKSLDGVSPRGARIAAEIGRGAPEAYVEFRPFDLPAGQQRAVELQFRMGACSELEPDSLVAFTALHVRYRTGLAERGENIELRSPVQFERTDRCRRRPTGAAP